MSFYYLFCNVETIAGGVNVRLERIFPFAPFSEESSHIVFCDADAVVFHGEANLRTTQKLYFNRAARRRVFDGVIDEISDGVFFQFFFISDDRVFSFFYREIYF